jgi:hypothetical protein
MRRRIHACQMRRRIHVPRHLSVTLSERGSERDEMRREGARGEGAEGGREEESRVVRERGGEEEREGTRDDRCETEKTDT